MSKQIERPTIVKNSHLEFLDDLRESGVTNMFGAAAYVVNQFPDVRKKDAITIVSYWMDTFGNENR